MLAQHFLPPAACAHNPTKPQEAQRVIHAKEQSIDSMRDTLAATKRNYEAKISALEQALAARDAAVAEAQQVRCRATGYRRFWLVNAVDFTLCQLSRPTRLLNVHKLPFNGVV